MRATSQFNLDVEMSRNGTEVLLQRDPAVTSRLGTVVG